MQGLAEFLKTLGVPRIVAMAAVTAGVIAFFAFIIVRVTSPAMTMLFTDLSQEDSSATVKDLERQGLTFGIRNDGVSIYVPKDKVTRLRMKLAEAGIRKGGAKMDVGQLLKVGPGAVVELDRKVGEAIDIYVKNRLVARGEVMLVEEKLGVTMTEIFKAERS